MRAAVIGVGSMGENHARIYSKLPDVELIGVFDLDYLRSIRIAETFETRAFKSLDDLLNTGIDVVSIAVPASSHLEAVARCARAGCHILLEKPLADTVENAEKTILECEMSGVRLMVGHVERFNPVVQAIKENLRIDDLISLDIVRVGPKPPRVKDVGVIRDMGIHDIDLIRYLTGKEVISAYSLVAGGDKEDIGIISFKLEDNILAHLTVNWITPFKVRKIQLAGSKGFIEADLLNRKALFYEKGEEGHVNGTKELPVAAGEPLEREIRTVVDCLRKDIDYPVSVVDAYRALQIAELCIKKPGELVFCRNEE